MDEEEFERWLEWDRYYENDYCTKDKMSREFDRLASQCQPFQLESSTVPTSTTFAGRSLSRHDRMIGKEVENNTPCEQGGMIRLLKNTLLTKHEHHYLDSFLNGLESEITCIKQIPKSSQTKGKSKNKTRANPRLNSSAPSLLNPEERRANHIAAEHKRRDRIREQLGRTCALVPRLRGTKTTQATLLREANDYIELLESEIATLRQNTGCSDSINVLFTSLPNRRKI